MKKSLFIPVILLVALVGLGLFHPVGCYAQEKNKEKDDKRTVKLSIKLFSQVKVGKEMKTIAINPTVITKNGYQATIFVGDKSKLNDKDVEMVGKNYTEPVPDFSSIIIVPTIDNKDNNKINLSVDFELKHYNKTLHQKFKFAVRDGENFTFENNDAESGNSTRMEIKADIVNN